MVSKKIFLDSLNRECKPENHAYTRVITNYSQVSARYVVTDFYKNGRKKMTGCTLDRDILKKDGEFIYFFKNGSKEAVINFKDDHKEGKEINWYENQIKKSEKQNIWNPKTKTSQTLLLNFWNENKEQIVTDGNGEYEGTEGFTTQKGTIKDGLKQGIWQGTDTLNKVTFIEKYEKGVLISGTKTDENNISYSYPSKGKEVAKKSASNH
ncbi:hypothetical protein [Flavobacterium sp. DG2-3]|uniref:hypothetical protein n=1 Tax=Flavobacterium sp. DG2-3 TaxID=3068317 RepID=UPI00273FAB29|nr:hypothetical protein [Flavobacterium sp. DG2-3]MDP5199235.1 hypothetical protein [Flavobacterium sp. DG2-3]